MLFNKILPLLIIGVLPTPAIDNVFQNTQITFTSTPREALETAKTLHPIMDLNENDEAHKDSKTNIVQRPALLDYVKGYDRPQKLFSDLNYQITREFSDFQISCDVVNKRDFESQFNVDEWIPYSLVNQANLVKNLKFGFNTTLTQKYWTTNHDSTTWINKEIEHDCEGEAYELKTTFALNFDGEKSSIQDNVGLQTSFDYVSGLQRLPGSWWDMWKDENGKYDFRYTFEYTGNININGAINNPILAEIIDIKENADRKGFVLKLNGERVVAHTMEDVLTLQINNHVRTNVNYTCPWNSSVNGVLGWDFDKTLNLVL